MNCWETWRQAQAYRILPSEVHRITDELAAWCFDRAIYLFGNTLDSQLAAADAGAKNAKQSNLRRHQLLEKWLGIPVQYKSAGGGKKAADVDSTAAGHVAL